jgi:hypothetical protein
MDNYIIGHFRGHAVSCKVVQILWKDYVYSARCKSVSYQGGTFDDISLIEVDSFC